jgi:NADH:ubiquinone oxidoreductase subunit
MHFMNLLVIIRKNYVIILLVSLYGKKMTIGTRLYSMFFGRLVGKDRLGNEYYVGKMDPFYRKNKRWILYSGIAEPTKVPPMCHAWLHYIIDDFPKKSKEYSWQQHRKPNLTGTKYAYFPTGHELSDSKRARATGDYESWKP